MKTPHYLPLLAALAIVLAAIPACAEKAAPAGEGAPTTEEAKPARAPEKAKPDEAAQPAAAGAAEGGAAEGGEVPLPPPPDEPEVRLEDEPGRVERKDDEVLVDMSFEKAEIVSVLRMLGRLAKTTLAIDSELTGQITIAATGRIPLREAFEIMNSVLQVKGYTLVGRLNDGVIKVLPEKQAVTSGVSVGMGKELKDIPEHDTYLTQIVPVEFIDAQRIAQELKPLVSSEKGSLVASSLTNHVIVTDTASNVRRVVSIINELDTDLSSVMNVEVITLKYANAETTAQMLERLFEQPRTGPGFRIDPRTGRPPGSPSSSSSRGGTPRPTPMMPGLMQTKEHIKFQSDERTNSIIVSASKDRIALVQKIIKDIDINLEPEIKVEVFKLEKADASTVAEELNQIMEQPQGGSSGRSSRFRFPWSRSSYGSSYYRSRTRLEGMTGLRENIIVADVRNNAIVATGTPENLTQVGELITKLDTESPLTDIMRIYPLENANAEDVENTLERAFFGPGRFRGFFSFIFGGRGSQAGAALDILQEISVEGDEKTNSLVVSAPPQAHELVEQMVRQLDVAQQQVYIEVAIVDVTLDDTTRLGVEWSWATPGQPQDTVGTNFSLTTLPGFAEGGRYTVVGRELNAVLAALMDKHDVRVLSTPLVTTTNNVRATVEIGTRYPYVERISQTAGGQIPQFGWYDITVSLQVTPRVKTALDADPADDKPDHYVQLEIVQELNELQGEAQQLGFTQPIVGSRSARTTVTAADGQTVVIGGMIRETTDQRRKKVPILSDLPLIGSLFRSTEDQTVNTELLVFLTPHVIKEDADIDALTDVAKKRTDTMDLQGLLENLDTKVTVGDPDEQPEDEGAANEGAATDTPGTGTTPEATTPDADTAEAMKPEDA